VAVSLTVATAAIAVNVYAQIQAPAPVRRSDVVRELPITKFYNTPDPFPAGKPGALIRSQEIEQYDLPYSVSAVRILYHSRSANGEDVAASGVVLFPYEKKPPAGGWPVIAWAHGSTGVARRCAPSLMRNIGHGPFLAMYVNLGYAVVATDYTGLGTSFRNAFLDGPSNATDVIASIPAARAAVPQLGARWIVMGEAEGGLTVVAVAEKENEVRDSNYLGGIAISDIAGGKEIYEPATAGTSSQILTSLAYGIKTVYPQFQVSDMLTEKGLALYHDTGETCGQATVPQLPGKEAVKPGWDSNGFVRQYFGRNDPGQTKAYGPILVISGHADPSKLAAATQAIGRMCKQGAGVQWERYPDLDPGSVIGESVRDQIGWIEGRFGGRPSPSNCP
jgi:pimeloyl-ACP methyl ester carboxylesterase